MQKNKIKKKGDFGNSNPVTSTRFESVVFPCRIRKNDAFLLPFKKLYTLYCTLYRNFYPFSAALAYPPAASVKRLLSV